MHCYYQCSLVWSAIRMCLCSAYGFIKGCLFDYAHFDIGNLMGEIFYNDAKKGFVCRWM